MRSRIVAGLASALALCSCTSLSAHLIASKKADYREAARVTEHTIHVAGHDVVYLDRGAGEPVVMVHGFGGDKDNWTFFAKELPDRFRVIALDLPGFGLSSRHPEESYDIRSQSARLLEFLDALAIGPAHFAGNSMGGQVVAQFAIDHPERVKSLALFDAAGVKSPHPSEIAVAFAEGRNPLVVSSVDDFDRLMSTMFVKPPDIPRFIRRYFAERAFENRAFNAKIFADIGAQPDPLEGQLARVSVPTLVLWGDTDRIIDVSAADVFAAGIPGARKEILPACGHAPMLEQPKETAAKYLDFVGPAAQARAD